MPAERRAVVIGAGVGGLSAALRLRRAGWRVQLLEAGPGAGGLASGLELEGFRFDGGPYVLLDRPGLEWAFARLGLALEDLVRLRRIGPLYEVRSGAERVRVHADLEWTAEDLDRRWPGAGSRYLEFARRMLRTWERLAPLQRRSRPGLRALLEARALPCVPFLFRSLGAVLRSSGLPRAVQDALGIWTHVASQPLDEAPSPMAFVPALIHGAGAWLPEGGVAVLPALLAARAAAEGVELRYGAPVARIEVEAGRVRGVATADGGRWPADAVVSNAHGVGTHVELLPETPAARRLRRLPLQSPGVCAYLAVRGRPPDHYLTFHLVDGEPCRLFIAPSVVDGARARDGRWWPARLLSPLAHGEAERLGEDGQRAWIEKLLAEDWWREGLEARVLAVRTPAAWGRAFRLHRDSMNPVMTARFMRQGRLPHRSPHARGLYLAGSSTHPGQWVSFCAISGVLAAERLIEDLG